MDCAQPSEIARAKTAGLVLRAADVLTTPTGVDDVLERLAEILLQASAHTRVSIALWEQECAEVRVAASRGSKPVPAETSFGFESVSDSMREAIVGKRRVIADYDVVEGDALDRDALGDSRLALIVPATFHDKVVGLVLVDTPGERVAFSEAAIELFEAMALQTAVGIHVAKLLEAERRARLRAEVESARLGMLRKIEAAVAAHVQKDEVASAFVAACKETIAADVVIVSEMDWETGRLRPLDSFGVQEGTLSDVDVTNDPDFETCPVILKGVSIIVPDATGLHPTDRCAATLGELGSGSYMLLPLALGDRMVGMLGLGWREPGAFGAAEVPFYESIANEVALALRTAQLFERKQESARLSEALNAINDDIHSSLRVDDILARVAASAADGLHCDSARVFLRDGARKWRLGLVHGMHDSGVGREVDPDDERHAVLAVETGDIITIEDSEFDPRVDWEHLRQLGARAVMIVPLARRGGIPGVVVFNYAQPHRFTKAEIDFGRKLASSLALALENAELYEKEQQIAETLQGALLLLPERIRGLSFAHAYHSATEAARVGGDFYDLFELDDRRVGITIGDISGKGLDAAVLTSLVKNAVRAGAIDGSKSPGEVVALANEVTLRGSGSELFATVFFGILDRHDGVLVYCNAGHTPPALVSGDSSVALLPSTAPLVGAFANDEYDEERTQLDHGTTLLLYTDGVTEARSSRVLFGESRLVQLLAGLGDRSPDSAVGSVVDEVLGYCGGRLGDDLALLALSRTGEFAS